jgi:lysyl-tRNA synthetase class 2
VKPTGSRGFGDGAPSDWGSTASRQAIERRAQLNRLVRDFFYSRDCIEVETPVLSEAGNTDPNIESFSLAFGGPRSAGRAQRWLRTSPEFALKRLLAGGIGDCYELGRVFRNGEVGRRHNPEFTLLEWYRVGWNHHRLMQEAVDLVQAALALVDQKASVNSISYTELFKQILGLCPHTASFEALQAPLAEFTINPHGLSRDDWLDLLLTHRIEPALAAGALTVVYDYPASQCALARVRPGSPPLAERFELYLGAIELANGYHELTDAKEQRVRFERDLAVRSQRGSLQPPIDARLLDALHAGLPSCAGVALGIDRLLMAMLGTQDIADVLAFPFVRA